MNDLVDLVLSQWGQECPNLDTAPMSVVSRVFRFNAFAVRDVNRAFKRYNPVSYTHLTLPTIYSV